MFKLLKVGAGESLWGALCSLPAIDKRRCGGPEHVGSHLPPVASTCVRADAAPQLPGAPGQGGAGHAEEVLHRHGGGHRHEAPHVAHVAVEGRAHPLHGRRRAEVRPLVALRGSTQPRTLHLAPSGLQHARSVSRRACPAGHQDRRTQGPRARLTAAPAGPQCSRTRPSACSACRCGTRKGAVGHAFRCHAGAAPSRRPVLRAHWRRRPSFSLARATQMAIKVADVGSLGESNDVYKRWVQVLEDEFFLQVGLGREWAAAATVHGVHPHDPPARRVCSTCHHDRAAQQGSAEG